MNDFLSLTFIIVHFYLVINLMIIVNLVVNVSESFLVTYIHHCTFLSDRKFDDYCEFSGECK